MGKSSHPIVVLTYHSVDDSRSVISVSPAMFEQQLRFLKGHGYESLALRDALLVLKSSEDILEKRLVITFDDGYQNNLSHALPLLKKYGFTATIFITTSRCGKMNDWPNQHSSIPSLTMLSWDEILELDHSGIDIGAHTQNHPHLTEVSQEVAEEEIYGSQKILEDKLGRAIPHFAYPYGNFDDRIRAIVQKTFQGAISTIPGRPSHTSDPFALERINAAAKMFRVLPLNFLAMGDFGGYLSLKTSLMRLKNLVR